MERTEELVHNLFTDLNELILHVNFIKGVPDLARVLFGSVEKNSTPEKKSTLEKNSSEMEKIRQTWMDDVVGLASEFYINEEAFNLENLFDLLKATVGAITDILALGPEESSVDQTFSGGHVYAHHKKKFTFLDKLREDRPDLRNDTDEDIWFCYCPSEFGYEEGCPYEEGKISDRCEKCWRREFKYSDTDSVNQTKEKTTKPTFHQWQTQKLSIEKPATFREKLAEKHPELINAEYLGGCRDCPGDFWNVPYKINTSSCTWEDSDNYAQRNRKCRICWDRLYKGDTPRTDSVKQTESWTCIDQLAKYHPEFVNEKYVGGAFECPITHGYNAKCLCAEKPAESTIEADALCRQCWKQPYKPQV